MTISRLTNSEIKKEILKCGKSCEYFILNYIKISHPTRGMIPFKMYDFQKETLQKIIDHRFNVILKSRQMGISTLIWAYCLWQMLFHRDIFISYVATKHTVAKQGLNKMKQMYKRLPIWIQALSRLTSDNATFCEFSNFSRMTAEPTSADASRASALTLLLLDEAAHVPVADEIYTSAMPTLSTGGSCIIYSTPNGIGNLFHKIFSEAESGKNEFVPTTLPYYVHPEYDEDWFESITKNMNEQKISQEYLCNFLQSGQSVFAAKDMKRIFDNLKEPEYKTGFDRNLWIWKTCQEGRSYLISADAARGDGEDYSVFHVIDTKTTEIVAEYQGKIPTDIFAEVLFNAGREYGNCMITVENNSVGFAVLQKLEEKEYPNIYYSRKSSHEFVEQYEAQARNDVIAGFTTSTKTRPLIINKMEEFIRNQMVKINSKRLYHEMETFVWNLGKPIAQRGYNDDLIMACAIGCWIKDTVLTIDQRNVEYIRAFMDSFQKSESVLDTTIHGMTDHNYIQKRKQQLEFEKEKREKEEEDKTYALPFYMG